MIINNNMQAMNTHRQLGLTTLSGAKSMEKLSSGFRINRAGDDAAGLSISEKMRAQIRGLGQASRNAQDSISLIQTAEGALTESHAILQRMRELAVQSANDTNVKVDREAIQAEIDELTAELTRIAETTEFNTQNLLGGKFEGVFHIGANEGQNISLTIGDMSAAALGVEGNVGLTQEITATVAQDVTDTVLGAAQTGDKFNVQKLDEAQSVGGVSDIQYVLKDADSNIVGISADGAEWELVGSDATLTNVLSEVTLGTNTGTWDISGTHTKVISGTIEITDVDAGAGAGSDEIHLDIKAAATLADSPELAAGTYTVVDGNTVPLPTGQNLALLDTNGKVVAYGETTGNTWVSVTGESLFDGEAVGLSVNDKVTVGGAGIDVSSQASASAAITTINSALETVSAQRSQLGAAQNRLEHTIKNLETSAENLQASESRIRDVDMAKEMMEFTKQNILQQAATAMLAQANQAPQGVLQLLR